MRKAAENSMLAELGPAQLSLLHNLIVTDKHDDEKKKMKKSASVA